MQQLINNEMRKHGGYKSIDILNVEYSADHQQAKVAAIIFMGNETKDEEISLVKENKDWKIDPN